MLSFGKQLALAALIVLAAGCSSSFGAPKGKGKTMNMTKIKFSDYGAKSDGSVNARDAFKAAFDACRAKGNCELIIDPGVYLISDPEAIKLRDTVMSLKDKSQDENSIFQFYFPYVTGLDMRDLKNVKVTAKGVTILCEGFMEPVTLEGSKNVCIEGLSISYKRLPFTQGVITKVEKDYYDVKLDADTPLTEGVSLSRISYWDPVRERLEPNQDYFQRDNEVLSDGTFRVHSSIPEKYRGFIVIFNHSLHFRPAILMNECEDITLKDVTIFCQPGMGIVGNKTRNVFMQGLRVVPLPGKKLSTNTDATHFTNCSGIIDFENCMFANQGDDATNLHNFYYTMIPVEGDDNSAILKVKAMTHALVLDAPEAGDIMEIVDYETMNVLTTMKVVRVEKDVKNLRSKVTFDTPLPNHLEKYACINASRMPSLRMRGCSIMSHRARGVLIKTRNVLIENCTIMETTLYAIHIGVEKGWGEGPGSENIVIRGNRFVRCGYGGGCTGICINCDGNEKSRVHDNILIENNIFESELDQPDVIVSYAKNVMLRHNIFSAKTKDPVKIKHAEKVVQQN